MNYRIAAVEVARYPVLKVTFDDGLSGLYDLGDAIATGPIFAPLKDESFFATVAVAEAGRSFGWNLDQVGDEIDFCPDATRIAIETDLVEHLAARHAQRLTVAQ